MRVWNNGHFFVDLKRIGAIRWQYLLGPRTPTQQDAILIYDYLDDSNAVQLTRDEGAEELVAAWLAWHARKRTPTGVQKAPKRG